MVGRLLSATAWAPSARNRSTTARVSASPDAAALAGGIDGEHPELTLVLAGHLPPGRARGAHGDVAQRHVGLAHGHPQLGVALAAGGVGQVLGVVVAGGDERGVRRDRHRPDGGQLVGAHPPDAHPQIPNVARG